MSLKLPPGNYPGSTAGTSISAGSVGEFLEAHDFNTVGTTYATIATLTLTTGVWLISGASYSSGNTGVRGQHCRLNIKGTTGATPGKTLLFSFEDILTETPRITTTLTFPSQVVVVASGDANKNIVIESRTSTGTGQFYAYISATRIA